MLDFISVRFKPELDNLLCVIHMGIIFILIFGQIIALGANFFVMYFKHMCSQSLRTCGFIIAEATNKRFGVRV